MSKYAQQGRLPKVRKMGATLVSDLVRLAVPAALRVLDLLLQGFAEFLVVRGAGVDLVFRAVKS
jgi:hypothetical protein